MKENKEKLDNTILKIDKILQKNKNNPEIREVYEELQKLMKKRNILKN